MPETILRSLRKEDLSKLHIDPISLPLNKIWNSLNRTSDFTSLPQEIQKGCIQATPLFVKQGKNGRLNLVSNYQFLPFLEHPDVLSGLGYYHQLLIILPPLRSYDEMLRLAFAPIALCVFHHLNRKNGIGCLRISLNSFTDLSIPKKIWGSKRLSQRLIARWLGVTRSLVRFQETEDQKR